MELGEEEKTFWRKGSFPLPQTPTPFSKPFIGIYLFALQKDKCPLFFEERQRY